MPPETTLEVTGIIVDASSQEPIENVEIIGFHGGVYHGNSGACYGQPVSLGTTDKCGKFQITLPDSIKGFGAHGLRDSTIVRLRLARPDFGEEHVTIPFESGTQTLSMTYSPSREPFFSSLYLVQSGDGKSVHIAWKIYSLYYFFRCPQSSFCFPCANTSNGNLNIWRSDSPSIRHTIPIVLIISK